MSLLDRLGLGRLGVGTGRQVGSLDRFVATRLPALAGITDTTRQRRVMGVLGGLYGFIGLGAALFAAQGGQTEVALTFAGTFGMFSTTMLLVRGLLGLREKGVPSSNVRLSKEATALAYQLIEHVSGMPFHPVRRRRHLRRTAARGLTPRDHDRRAADVLSEATCALLEDAAREYNRIVGALAMETTATENSVTRLGPRILTAADEAMAAVLHSAALMERYPETASRLDAEARQQVEGLAELGGEVERLQVSDGQVAALPTSTNAVRSVLEELRAESRAREEVEQSVRLGG